MKLPLIKNLNSFIEEKDEDYVVEAIEVLENLTESPALTEQELDVIGELLSNMYGAIEVHREIKKGTPTREALNGFMKRVMGSIDN